MLRLIEIFIPDRTDIDTEHLLDGRDVLAQWVDNSSELRKVLNLLVPADEVEAVCDRFEEAFSGSPMFHMVLLPVEGVLPRPKVEPPPEDEAVAERQPKAEVKRYGREIGRASCRERV